MITTATRGVINVRLYAIGWAAGVGIGAVLLWGLLWGPDNMTVCLTLLLLMGWAMPGILLAGLWRLPNADGVATTLLAMGLGLCWFISVALLVHWLPGEISRNWLIGAYGVGNAFLFLLALYRPILLPRRVGPWQIVAIVIVVAFFLRVPGLGYAEFHADEVQLLTRAREAIRGEDDALARHSKGPGEIAVTTAILRTLNTVDEGTARLPFALAAVLGVGAVALLGARLFNNRWVGGIAGILFALNGFALGLSRIVQYQPLILLLMALALLTAWEFAQSGKVRWGVLTIVFTTFGILLHYEVALIVPALLWLAWRGWHRIKSHSALWRLFLAGSVGVVTVALVYAQNFFHPYFQQTTQVYASMRMGGGLHWNGEAFLNLATFYNSIYFWVGVLLLVGIGIVYGWYRARFQTILLVLWFLPYSVLYLIVVEHPGTHFYMMMESWSLLAALPLGTLLTPTPQHIWRRWGMFALFGVWVSVSLGYLYMVFFRETNEYIVNYPNTRVPLYWAPYGDNLPREPRFGLPIREGWQVLGVISEWGFIRGTYASNEHSPTLRWYSGALERVDWHEQPDYIFIADHLQEIDPAFNAALMEGYQVQGEIRVRGEPRILIYARTLLPTYWLYDAEAFSDTFVQTVVRLGVRDSDMIQAVQPISPSQGVVAVAATRPMLHTNGTLETVVTWTPSEPLPHNYKLFVHLLAASDHPPVLQWDGYPQQNTAQTSTWQVGETYRDLILLPISCDVPSGTYTLVVGLYDGESGARLGAAGATVGEVQIGGTCVE